MKASMWIRKYFGLAVVIVFLFVLLGFLVSRFVSHAFAPKMIEPQPIVPVFMAKVLDEMRAPNKLAALKHFEELKRGDVRSPDFFLVDALGQIVYSTNPENSDFKNSIPLEKLAALKKPYDYSFIEVSSNVGRPPIKPPPFMGIGFGLPSPLGGFGPRISIIRLSGEPAYFLGIQYRGFKLDFENDPQRDAMMKWGPLLGIGSLFLSLLIGIGVTLFVIYLLLYKKIIEADNVINELHKGNLKARFKVNRNDEFGEAMGRFNKMADEIELLVERLRETETSRTKLTQELAHDLRTPIASLKNLVDLLSTKYDQLKPEVKAELWHLTGREVNYFELLVEELLTLSQFNDPNFDQSKSAVDLGELVKTCLSDQIAQTLQDDKKMDFEMKTEVAEDFKIHGDELLLRRMIRNLVDNSASFARSKVICCLVKNQNKIEITIIDDGPGLTPEQIANYGRRKSTRQIIRAETKDERISIGLGTVVVRKIVEIHRGEIHVENHLGQNGNIQGAVVKITF